MKEVRIPEDRVAVLIGEGGETKEEFEDVTDCSLEVRDNVAKVDGEPIEEMNGQKVVKAIGRGFSPEKAFRLATEERTDLVIIDVNDYASTSNERERLKGRVIGRDGETRRHVEKEANIDIAIYGSTVGMIGRPVNIEVALESIRMLLQGSSHSTAYGYLEKNQTKIEH
ncbi:MAG: pre-rRNA-processing protein PNO1 [Candidatus Nanohaloarchaea archaeon]